MTKNTSQWILRHCSQGKHGLRGLQASGTFFCQLTSNFVLCLFLFQDTFLFISIYCGFINTELTANSTLTHAWTKLTNTYSLHRAPDNLLTLRNAKLHFSTTLGSHCKHWNHQQKEHPKNAKKKWHQIDQEETHYRMSTETRKEAQGSGSAGNTHLSCIKLSGVLQIMTKSTIRIDLAITNKF